MLDFITLFMISYIIFSCIWVNFAITMQKQVNPNASTIANIITYTINFIFSIPIFILVLFKPFDRIEFLLYVNKYYF